MKLFDVHLFHTSWLFIDFMASYFSHLHIGTYLYDNMISFEAPVHIYWPVQITLVLL